MAIEIRCAINQQTADFFNAHASKCNEAEWDAVEELGAWWQQYQNGWRVVLSSAQVDRMIYLRDIMRDIKIPELGIVYLRDVLKNKRLELTRELSYEDHIEHELDIIRILFPEQVLPQMIWGFEPGSFKKDGKIIHIKGERHAEQTQREKRHDARAALHLRPRVPRQAVRQGQPAAQLGALCPEDWGVALHRMQERAGVT